MLARVLFLARLARDRGDELLDDVIFVVRAKLLPALAEMLHAVGRYLAHRFGVLARWFRG